MEFLKNIVITGFSFVFPISAFVSVWCLSKAILEFAKDVKYSAIALKSNLLYAALFAAGIGSAFVTYFSIITLISTHSACQAYFNSLMQNL